MKFDKRILESGIVAAFSLVLTLTSVPASHASTKTDPENRIVELAAAPTEKIGEELVTKEKKQVEMVMAAKKQNQSEKEESDVAKEKKTKKAAQKQTEKEPETEKTEKAEKEPETEKTDKTEKEPEAEKTDKTEKEPEAEKAEKTEKEPEAEKAEKTEEELETEKEDKAEKEPEAEKAEKTEEELETEKADKAEKEPETEKEEKETKKKAKKKKKKAKKKQAAKDELVETGTQEVSPWAKKLMPNVEEFLNIRTEASEEAELAGKLPKGAVAEILEQKDGWTKISSGSVEGYVKDEFCVTGLDAEALANQLGTTYATAVTGGVRVREEASPTEETKILDVLEEGGKIKVDKDAEPVENWVAVEVDDQIGYVSAEYVAVELELGKAISIEEERAAIAAAEAERKAKEAEEAARQQAAQEEAAQQESSSTQQESSSTQQKAATAASYDDVTLLGALIQCEAGSEPYEGQLAVGAVVMNRLRAGYAGSISGVIYQGGQFTPASNGMLQGVLSSGVSGSCIQAAQEAINGVDNVNGATSFRRAGSGMGGTVIGNHVFF